MNKGKPNVNERRKNKRKSTGIISIRLTCSVLIRIRNVLHVKIRSRNRGQTSDPDASPGPDLDPNLKSIFSNEKL
jgi:hypothetical protein